MPEGPSIVILKEETVQFAGKKVIAVTGNTKLDLEPVKNNKINSIKSYGKHFLICFKDFTIRIHFLLFGSYRINEKKDKPERLSLKFKNGELNLYACSVKYLEGDVNDHYDWTADVMNDNWSARKAKVKLKSLPGSLACDVLLNQEIFAGVGNIIKNEVLYRIKVHPESKVAKLPALKLKKLIDEARNYSFEFLEWKKQYVLKKHWLAHAKKVCLRCDKEIVKKYTGENKRRSFICLKCQVLYK